jgi:DNA-binding CsgD family transcriptional regulator/PAS domain-containing protein
MDTTAVESIAGGFYEAALDPGRLEPALAELAQFGGAKGANFLQASIIQMRGIVVGGVGEEREAIEAYNTRYRDMDPLTPLALKSPVGSWLNDWKAFGDAGYAKSEYFNEFIRPFGNHAVMACVLTRDQNNVAAFSLQRNPSQGVFTAQDEERLRPLVGHLQRASRLYTATAHLRERADIASALLDHSSPALWVLERSGRVVLANARAERLAADPSLFRYFSGVLETVHDPRRWHVALSRATTSTAAQASWLQLPLGEGPAQPIAIAPLVASSHLGRNFQRPLAAVLAQPPHTEAAAALPAALRCLYGLTPAEARVACSLGEGLAPRDIAATLAVAEATVRTQLKAVFAKTRVRRQAELMRLVMNLRNLCRRSP